MFTAEVTDIDILAQEESLSEYKRRDLPDWNKKINQAKLFVAREIRSNGKELKKICIPLTFADDLTNSGTFVSAVLNDNVERRRFVIEPICTGQTIFALKGCNKQDGTFLNVPLINYSGTEGLYLISAERKRQSAIIKEAYNFYKLEVTGNTSRTFNAYLIEDTFDLPVLFKTLELIFKGLQAEKNSNFEGKSEYYRDLFNDTMQNAVYSYDEDQDNVATLGELGNTKSIRLVR